MSGASVASALGRFARGFLRWYWKLTLPGMVMTTVALVIAANYVLRRSACPGPYRAAHGPGGRLSLLSRAG